MKLTLLLFVNALIGVLLAYCWHVGSGIEAAVSGLLALLLLIGEGLALQEKPVTRGPLLYVPRDRVIGMDQHRADRQAHVTHLQRGFRTQKGRAN